MKLQTRAGLKITINNENILKAGRQFGKITGNVPTTFEESERIHRQRIKDQLKPGQKKKTYKTYVKTK